MKGSGSGSRPKTIKDGNKSLFDEGLWNEAAELFAEDCRIKGLFSKASAMKQSALLL